MVAAVVQTFALQAQTQAFRDRLAAGELDLANAMLLRPYEAEGTIIGGRRLGRTIGFPTVNIAWEPELKPAYGVYAVEVIFKGEAMPAVANYGQRPTVESGPVAPLLEAHVLRGTAPTTGDAVRVRWVRRLRTEQKFADLAAQVLPEFALDAVLENQLAVGYSQAHRRQAAGAGLADAAPVYAAAGFEFAAAAVAFEGIAGGHQGVVRRRIRLAAGGLEPGRLVGRQAEGGQGGELPSGGARNFTRRIEVFDADQPFTARAPRVQPAAQGRHQRTKVQRPGGRGREAAAVGGLGWHHHLNLTVTAYI